MQLIRQLNELSQTQRAGVVPYFYDDGGPVMMFMVSSDADYGGSSPAIAKGHIDTGETAQQAALREGAEELGLRSSNMVDDSISKVWTGQLEGLDEKYILNLFACEIKNKSDFDVPHFETEKTVWLSIEEFRKVGRKSHLFLVEKVASII